MLEFTLARGRRYHHRASLDAAETKEPHHWIRKPQPPLDRGSWLPQQHRESFLDTIRRQVRERREQAEQEAIHAEQWRRDMAELEREKHQAAKGRRWSSNEPITRTFHKGDYTRATDTITVQDKRERHQKEFSTARHVANACDQWLRSHGINPAANSWQATQAERLRQRNQAATE